MLFQGSETSDDVARADGADIEDTGPCARLSRRSRIEGDPRTVESTAPLRRNALEVAHRDTHRSVAEAFELDGARRTAAGRIRLTASALVCT